ncbi:nucleotidyltransferase family protein [Rhizobium etli]|uniref:nucleotidyltransferase family protein n=1 Tax=Rhizobium etli TaxID=29449 RepID=UPI0003839273|nr:nucleotidyltransferase family protein [Rhizobium etli]AGS20626.1 CBS domain-containing protein [Rhizobium etli bv. mimosae str. Mim1]
MSDLQLRPDAPLMAAVRAIEASRRRIAIVVGADEHLLGTLTDGDVRRCLLDGGTLETPVSHAMNSKPVTAKLDSSSSYLLDLMRRGNILAIPQVDDEGRFRRLVHLTDLCNETGEESKVSAFEFAVIMAGGEGIRLRPLTEKIPKPMIDIGGLPLLERQIKRLVRNGVQRVYLSVNYLGYVIEDHFGDGTEFDIEIRYLRENEKLGTAGALSLLPEKPSGSVLVMNGDILTTSSFDSLHSFHKSNGACVTVAAVDYRVNIPYGVIHAEGQFIRRLEEKPSQRFFCNAGIYAVSPEALDLVTEAKHCNMTDVVETCLSRNLPVAVFPVHEYWSDIGTLDDLEKARTFFSETTIHEK